MAKSDIPAWNAAAVGAALRLAAEAESDVDEILGHPGEASPERLALQVVRLEESADISEVATDLAGLLWAEGEAVPPIATMLDDPASRSALEGVADARRRAARRLGDGWIAREAVEPEPLPDPWAAEPAAVPAAAPEDPLPVAPGSAPGPSSPAGRPGSAGESGHRPAKGAALAGAAAAVVLFGRRLRRA